MKKEVLEQYASIKLEICDLDRLIDKSRRNIRRYERELVSDTVSGTRDDGTIGPIRITGIADRLLTKEHERLSKLLEKQERARCRLQHTEVAVESYIQGIADSEIRRIARLRYLEDLEWQQVAVRMGRGYTAGGCRMKIERFFRKE